MAFEIGESRLKFLSWEASDNCKDASYPLKIKRFVPAEAGSIFRAPLSFTIENFRAYTTASDVNSATTAIAYVTGAANMWVDTNTANEWYTAQIGSPGGGDVTITISGTTHTEFISMGLSFMEADPTDTYYFRLSDGTNYYPNEDGAPFSVWCIDYANYRHTHAGGAIPDSWSPGRNNVSLTLTVPGDFAGKTLRPQFKTVYYTHECQGSYFFMGHSRHLHDMTYDIYEKANLGYDGFENGNYTETPPWTVFVGAAAKATVQTSTVKTGTYALQIQVDGTTTQTGLQTTNTPYTVYEAWVKTNHANANARYQLFDAAGDEVSMLIDGVYVYSYYNGGNADWLAVGSTNWTKFQITISPGSGTANVTFKAFNEAGTELYTRTVSVTSACSFNYGYVRVIGTRAAGAGTHLLHFDDVTFQAPPSVSIKINGTDRTTALGGPWTTDQDSIDIKEYMHIGEFNIIELIPNKLCRLSASIPVYVVQF